MKLPVYIEKTQVLSFFQRTGAILQLFGTPQQFTSKKGNFLRISRPLTIFSEKEVISATFWAPRTSSHQKYATFLQNFSLKTVSGPRILRIFDVNWY